MAYLLYLIYDFIVRSSTYLKIASNEWIQNKQKC